MSRFSGGSVTELLRVRSFRLQFSASFISLAGSSLTPIALTLGLLELGASASELGLVLTAYAVPQVVFMLAGGVFADRWSRRAVMLFADLARFLSQGIAGVLLIAGKDEIALFMLLQFVAGSASAMYMPASAGLVVQTAPARLRKEAASLLELVRNTSGIAGPLVGVALVSTVGAGWALAIDGLTYLISSILLACVRDLPEKGRADDTSLRVEVADGLREVASRPWLWSFVAYCAVFNFAYGVLQVIGPVSLEAGGRVYAWGYVLAALSVGEIIGTAYVLKYKPARPLFLSRILMVLGCAPLFLFLAQDAGLLMLCLAAALLGASISVPDTLWSVCVLEHVEESRVSRVFSVDMVGSFGTKPLALALAAWFAALVGPESALLWVAGLVLVAGGLLFLDRQGSRLGLAPDTSTVKAS